MRTSPSAFASASILTTVTRPTPSASAIALWVISSTKYIQAARCRRRSLRLGARRGSPVGRSRASVLSNRQALLEHHAGPRPQFLALALELAAGGQNVAASRRAHRARVASVEDNFREALDRLPVRAFECAPRPRIERNKVDLGRQTLEQTHERL